MSAVINELRRANSWALLELENRCHAGTGQIIVISDQPCLIKNAKDQIEYLKQVIGFNVSQLAAILMVKRPTIYEWLENKEPNRSNQERLDLVFSLFKSNWGDEKYERLGSYFYKKIDNNKSLFDLLTEEKINEFFAKNYIINIKNELSKNYELRNKREDALLKGDFKPVSKEEKEQALKFLMRKV